MKVKHTLLFLLVFVLSFPLAGQDRPFSFVMLTDTQMGMYTANKSFERETANYEFVVAALNRLKPSFAIVLGDLVNKEGDPAQIAEFQRITKKIDPAIPVYFVAGNHDIGHEPTPETIAAYRAVFGRDYYSFRAGLVYGIVLNSTVIHAPTKVESEYRQQLSWLKEELEKARATGARHIVVFQHHPFFISDPEEPDNPYVTISRERRKPFLDLLRQYGVKYVFAGHVHKCSTAKDGDLEMTVTGPVAMPFGEDGSGIRLVEVTADGLRHRYHEFGKMPDNLSVK